MLEFCEKLRLGYVVHLYFGREEPEFIINVINLNRILQVFAHNGWTCPGNAFHTFYLLGNEGAEIVPSVHPYLSHDGMITSAGGNCLYLVELTELFCD